MATGPLIVDGTSPRAQPQVKLTMQDYRGVAIEVARESKRDDVPSLAAGVAFKIFLSLFPSLIAAVAIFSLVISPDELPGLLDTAGQVLPETALEPIRALLGDILSDEEGVTRGFAVVGVVGGIWTATSAAVTLLKALSRAYDVEERRRFFMLRLTALVLTSALFLALVAVFVLLVAGGTIESVIVDRMRLIGPAETAVDLTATLGRYVLAILVVMVLFAFVYWIGPDRDRRPPWEWISPGAVIGVVTWLLVSVAFRMYVSNLGNFREGSTYAGIGGFIVLLLWLQLTMGALLVGAEVNAELHRARNRRRDVLELSGFGADVPPGSEDEPDALAPEPVIAGSPRNLTGPVTVVAAPMVPAVPGNAAGRPGASGSASAASGAAIAAAAAGTVGLIGLVVGWMRLVRGRLRQRPTRIPRSD